MDQANFMLTIALTLNIFYLGLAMVAYQHLRPENRASESTRLLALTLWWPFYDVYKKSAKPYRILGAFILIACIGAYTSWAIIK